MFLLQKKTHNFLSKKRRFSQGIFFNKDDKLIVQTNFSNNDKSFKTIVPQISTRKIKNFFDLVHLVTQILNYLKSLDFFQKELIHITKHFV